MPTGDSRTRKFIQNAIRLAERDGLYDDRLASVLANLGWLQIQQGRAADGKPLLRRAVKLYGACGEDCALPTARSFRHLLRLQGRFGSAEQAIREGLSRKSRGANAAEETALLLDELGWVYLHRNQPHVAAGLFTRGIEELADAPSERDSLAGLYQSLATANIVAGKLTEAEQACLRALELVETKTSPHVVAGLYTRLGEISTRTGKYQAAEDH